MHSLSINSAILVSASLCRLHALADQSRLHRPERVIGLLVAVFVMSMFDLSLTIHQVSTTGMFEDNPLARLAMTLTGSPASLGSLKATSLLVSMGLLVGLRRHWQAEIGAWLALGILVWLIAQWTMYLAVMSDIRPDMFTGFGLRDGFVAAR